MSGAIFFCDFTGNMAKPWIEAGIDCVSVDIQHPRGITKMNKHWTVVGADIHELYRGHWWLPESACFAFAFPDCTYLTISGNKWQEKRGPGCVGRGLLFADACWRLCVSFKCPWGIENPAVGRLTSWRQPDHKFHPWEYAGYLDDMETDNTSKQTGLWVGGGFVMPEKKPAPEPHRTDCHVMAPGPDRAAKRSETPMGFARAVFSANAPAPTPVAAKEGPTNE